MHLIKLNAIDSTNSYIRKLSSEVELVDYTVVSAKYQTNGRGQMGAVWNSENSKNLTVSVFKDVSKLYLEHPFYISMATSLALIKTVQSFSIPKLSIKWPNDILSEDKKICGILIENVIKQNRLRASIIGVGLNVNQTDFEGLPKAASLKLLLGNTFNLDEVLYTLIKYLKYYFMFLRKEEYDLIKREYESFLFRKNKPSTFRDAKGVSFSGIIKNVSSSGSLQVLIEDDIIKDFDFKELTLLY
ncbi:MAG TPA: biotin--[acetyl-CoA-carboxylase] ligase [Yeosuana sp.]